MVLGVKLIVDAVVAGRAECNPVFRDALLTETVDPFWVGDRETGKAVLRDAIDASAHSLRLRAPGGGEWGLVQEPEADAQSVGPSRCQLPVHGAVHGEEGRCVHVALAASRSPPVESWIKNSDRQ